MHWPWLRALPLCPVSSYFDQPPNQATRQNWDQCGLPGPPKASSPSLWGILDTFYSLSVCVCVCTHTSVYTRFCTYVSLLVKTQASFRILTCFLSHLIYYQVSVDLNEYVPHSLKYMVPSWWLCLERSWRCGFVGLECHGRRAVRV